MEENHKWAAAGKLDGKRTRGARQQPSEKCAWRNWRDLFGVTVCFALSLFCIGVCVVVFVRTSDLQSRLLRLEQQHRDAKLSAWMESVEQVEPVILGRLDRILEEVSGAPGGGGCKNHANNAKCLETTGDNRAGLSGFTSDESHLELRLLYFSLAR